MPASTAKPCTEVPVTLLARQPQRGAKNAIVQVHNGKVFENIDAHRGKLAHLRHQVSEGLLLFLVEIVLTNKLLERVCNLDEWTSIKYV